MLNANLFQWLVEYHCRRNLEACLPYIEKGIVHPPNKKALREGLDENELYKGLLIVANGSELTDRLLEDKIVFDEEIDGFFKVKNENDLFKYLDGQESSDGAFVYDSIKQRITKVYELNNNPKNLSRNHRGLIDRLPWDFVSQNGGLIPAGKVIGTKTRLAIKLPQFYDNTQTFQIKRTAYTPLGIGKVTHFNKEGLVEEFFLMYNPNNKGPFIDPKNSIAGVCRSYSPKDGELTSERIVGRDYLK